MILDDDCGDFGRKMLVWELRGALEDSTRLNAKGPLTLFITHRQIMRHGCKLGT